MAGLDSLRTLERKSTSARIVAELRQMIIEGELAPGEQLAEARIAELLGVSRAPVREALQQLVQQQLLVAARNRGVSVVTFSSADIWEIYDARVAIETHAAKRILDRGPQTARACDELRTCLDELRRAVGRNDRRLVSAADLEFHRTFVAAAQNSRLTDAYTILSAQALTCINRLELARPSGTEIIDDHQVLVDLLARSDGEGLQAAIVDHLTAAARNLTAPPAR
ncbi:GntR family transcriptional regulator [Williamsia sp. CHRR-6]|uniref:GntR family transcriptional regulator n=1 Tax=Williamsia sp. CHRR-6 TaxID=2835871 RepID=UPI001BDA05A3|nr:GntR family transcriptional regulator [Williamsia sp. CHRR-6]MBT0566807.1 GntR family transcriptional regulator [Williamsia sp. CHRR-6]